MSKCKRCNVTINSNTHKCPLCNNEITINKVDDVFPIIENKYKYHQLFFDIGIFITTLGNVLCLLINYIINKDISWSLYVVASTLTYWFTLIIAIKRRNNVNKLLLLEVIVASIGSIVWDYLTGWHLWSITYVLPFLCIAYITIFIIKLIFINNIKNDYIFYTMLNSLIGLIPFYFIFRNIIKITWPSILSISLSLSAIIFLIIFKRKILTNELEKRLHI